jgi:hypothetical protein
MLQSADGITWATNTAAGTAATHKFAENGDQTPLVNP